MTPPMTSWNIKVGGIILAIGGYMSTVSDPWWVYKVGNLLNIVGALMLGQARSNGVPSSAVPAAAAKDAQIKSDTQFIEKQTQL